MTWIYGGIVVALVAAGTIVALVNRRALPPIPDEVDRG